MSLRTVLTSLRSSPRRPRTLIALIAAVLLVAGLTAAAFSAAGSMNRAAETVPAVSTDRDSDAVDRGDAGGLQDPTAPAPVIARTDATATRVEIPKIAVDSTLEQLSLDPRTGELTPPAEWLSAGWYQDGTVPGDVGPAVIAGHVDSVTKPAVFARLGELVAGDQIRVTLSNGEVEDFVVDSLASAPKDAFPTAAVYGPTPTAQLRVITCDGIFNSATGHYLDNLIVNAHLVP